MKKYLNGVLVEMTAEEIAAMQPSLDARREQVVRQIEELSVEKISSFSYDFGPGYGVLHMQLRDVEDRTNWLTLRTTATELIGVGLGENPLLAIRTAENITVPVTANAAAACLRQMAIYGGDVMARTWALKDAVRASDNPESIDITEGWPQ